MLPVKKAICTLILCLAAFAMGTQRIEALTILGSNFKGGDLVPADGDVLYGDFNNVGTFYVAPNSTIFVAPRVPFSISAAVMDIDGVLELTGNQDDLDDVSDQTVTGVPVRFKYLPGRGGKEGDRPFSLSGTVGLYKTLSGDEVREGGVLLSSAYFLDGFISARTGYRGNGHGSPWRTRIKVLGTSLTGRRFWVKGSAGWSRTSWSSSVWKARKGEVGTAAVIDNEIDNVVATPEPSTLLLLGSALAGLGLLGKRKGRADCRDAGRRNFLQSLNGFYRTHCGRENSRDKASG